MRTLSKDRYLSGRLAIKRWVETKPDSDWTKEISYMALSTGIPIIIVLEFLMEIVGRTDELVACQKRLMESYQIDEIV